MNKAVEDENLQLLIDNMRHYPSASNTRPTEITIIKTNEDIGIDNSTLPYLNTIKSSIPLKGEDE
jgi:hypothetical protein